MWVTVIYITFCVFATSHPGSSFLHVANGDNFLDSNDNYIQELFMKNLYEDFKLELNNSLTPEIQDQIDTRVEEFQNSRRTSPHATSPFDKIRKKRGTDETRTVYALTGYQEAGTVPVNFPKDICLFKVNGLLFAAVLHSERLKGPSTLLTLFKVTNEGRFIRFFEYKSAMLRSIDCTNGPVNGFVAAVNHFRTHDNIEAGAPVFQITPDFKVNVVLTKTMPYLNSAHFYVYGDEVFLSYTYIHPHSTTETRKPCPIYKWTGTHFILIDEIECYNSHHIERFTIDYELFLVVANYVDDNGKPDTFSFIYKFNPKTQKFFLFQKISTQGAHDIRYFRFDFNNVLERFLIVQNEYRLEDDGQPNYNVESVIYKYVNHHFVPMQSLMFDNVTQIMPVVGPKQEFLLLVACDDKEVQSYQYDGWKFVDAPVDYTREAFGRGVQSIRYYNDFTNRSLIVMANENHKAGDTALFFPIFKPKNDAKKLYREYIDWAQSVIDRYTAQNLKSLWEALKRLPSVNSPEITIKNSLELANAVIKRLDTWAVTRKDKTLDNRLVRRINEMKTRVDGLKKRINQLSKALMNTKPTSQSNVKPKIGNKLKGDSHMVASPALAQGSTLSEALLMQTDQSPSKTTTTTLRPTKASEKIRPKERKSVRDQEIIRRIGTEAPKIQSHEPQSLNESPQISKPHDINFDDQIVQNQVKGEDAEFIENLFIKSQLDFKTLNGHSVDAILHTDSINAPELMIGAREVVVDGPLYVNGTIDGVIFNSNNVLLKNANQHFKTNLSAENVTVNHLFTPTVNGKSSQSFIDSQLGIVRSAPIQHFDKIEAEEIYIDGWFNGGDIRELNSLLLKSTGNQMIEAPFEFENLTATEIILLKGALSDKTASDLISTKKGDYAIDQTMEFSKHVNANNLVVLERLNNIQVRDEKLDVLLKESPEPQIVSGSKSFEHVQLQNPISLQGRIESETLTKMNPVSTIPEDIILEGDYEIHGEVSIQEILDAADIVGRSGSYSAVRLQRYGLPLESNHSSLNFIFNQPIRVKNLFTRPTESFNPDDFVKTGTDRPQHITGYKQFTGDLKVKGGMCEALTVNRVDLESLDKNMLKRSGDQVVTGRIQFNRIETKGVAAMQTKLTRAHVDLNNYLTLDTEQKISSDVTITGPVVVENELTVKNLYANGQFNDINLEYLIKDTVVNDDTEYHITGEKSFDSMNVQNLNFGLKGRLNGIEMNAIAWNLDSHDKEIIYDSLYLEKPLKFKNLVVEGTINGVPALEFGRGWLLSEGDQEFTVPVQLQHAVFESNVELYGKFNDHDLDYLIENTIWTNQDQELGDIEIVALSSHTPIQVDGLISGAKFPDDFLLKNSTEPQYVPYFTIKSHLTSTDGLKIINTLNGLPYNKLNEFGSGQSQEKTPGVLKVLGNANFLVQPHFDTINGIDIEELYATAWLAHRSTVLKGYYHLKSAEFVQNILSTGLINGNIDLNYINANYFSLTKPQDIKGRFYFQNGTKIYNLLTDAVKLGGKIRSLSDEKKFELNLDYFNKYVLKKDEDQEITGFWNISKLIIKGNLNDIRINSLTFVDDVVRYDVDTNHFTEEKFFENVLIDNIHCESCIIQDTDVGQWMNHAVLNYGDYELNGDLTIDNLTVYGSIEVDGPINGKTFTPSTVFLKDKNQIVTGPVTIQTDFGRDGIVAVSIDNLYVNEINGREVQQVLAPELHRSKLVASNLDFVQPLVVGRLHTNGHKLYNVDIEEKLRSFESESDLSSYSDQFVALQHVGEMVREAKEATTSRYLSHFKVESKGITGTFDKIVPVTFSDEIVRLAAFDSTDPSHSIQFYRYTESPTESLFELDEDFPPLQAGDSRITNIGGLQLFDREFLVVEKHTGEAFNQIALDYSDGVLQRIYYFNSTYPTQTNSLRLKDMDCIIRYSDKVTRSEIACFGTHQLSLYQSFEGAPIAQAVTLTSAQTSGDDLLVLTADGNVLIYSAGKDGKLTLKQSPLQLLNPAHIDGICKGLDCYIGICSEKTENAVHFGSVEIYRSLNGSEYQPFQTISVKTPVKVQFTNLMSNDLVLYVLTEAPGQSVIVYKYQGVAGFKEHLSSSTVPKGKSMTIVKLPQKREMLAIIANEEVVFIEPVMKLS